MVLKVVLANLHLDQSPEHLLRVASNLCSRLSAKLIVTCAADAAIPIFATDGLLMADIYQSEVDEIELDLKAMGKAVKAACSRETEFRSEVSVPLYFLSKSCRSADIVITNFGQEGAQAGLQRNLEISRFLQLAGRPVLIMPDEVETLELKEVVTI